MTETNAESREKFVRFLEVWAKLKKPLYSSIEKLPPVPQEHRELVLSYYKMTYGGVEIPINELVKKNFVWSSVEKEWAAKKGDKYEFSHHRFGFFTLALHAARVGRRKAIQKKTCGAREI